MSRTVGYGYTDGNLTSMSTPSGQSIAYGYTDGKVTSISVNGTTLLSGVLYDPFGPARQWTWGNSTLAVRTFDLDGKVDQIDSAGLHTYSYDDAFRITGIADASNSALSWSYAYDNLDRLTSGSKTGTTQGFTYDANGNRLTQTGTTASTFSIASGSNRLASTSGALTRTYSYDSAGNTTGYAGITFAYNNRGRMKSATVSSVTTNYALNALGQRVKKSNSSVTRLFVYDEAGQLVGEYDGSGNLVQETIWFGDIPVAVLKPNGSGGINVFYIHSDHLNTPRRITRPSDNAVVWRWDSDAFGATAANENPSALGVFAYGLRFPGQYHDSETGLSYNYFRDYDSATGRYVESDPIGLRGGINTYAYVSNAPIDSTDALGLRGDVSDWVANPTSTCARVVFRGTSILAGLFIPDRNPQGECSAAVPPPESSCPGNDDECRKIYADIEAAMAMVKRRYWHFIADPRVLPERGPMSRETHRKAYRDWQRRIRNLIEKAIAKGCLAYNGEAWLWATRPLIEIPNPDRPMGPMEH